MKDANILAARVRERRMALNLTQEELAEKAGLGNRLMVSNIERGKTGVLPETLTALASAMQCLPAYLMGLTDTPLPVPVAPPVASAPKITLKADPIKRSSHYVWLTCDASSIVRKLEAQTNSSDWKIVSDIIVQAEKFIRINREVTT